jgi:hypothetical protein
MPIETDNRVIDMTADTSSKYGSFSSGLSPSENYYSLAWLIASQDTRSPLRNTAVFGSTQRVKDLTIAMILNSLNQMVEVRLSAARRAVRAYYRLLVNNPENMTGINLY